MLTHEQIRQWRTQGYVLVKNVFNPCAARVEIENYLQGSIAPEDWGADAHLEFPSPLRSLNRLALHPNIIGSCQQLLNDQDVVLNQAVAWPKYGHVESSTELSNRDQRVHQDWPNHTLAMPDDIHRPADVVACLAYISDTRITGGGTAVVGKLPHDGDDGNDDDYYGNDDDYFDPAYVMSDCVRALPGVGPHPFINDRRSAEQYFARKDPRSHAFRRYLYERETRLAPSGGSVLFYKLTTWHRGTPVFPKQTRLVANICYRRGGARGYTCWNSGWWQKNYQQWFLNFLATLAPIQLRALDVPGGVIPGYRLKSKL